jgi:hypothetical protein
MIKECKENDAEPIILFKCRNCRGVVQYTKPSCGLSGWGHYLNGGSCVKAAVSKESWKHWLLYKKALKTSITLHSKGEGGHHVI